MAVNGIRSLGSIDPRAIYAGQAQAKPAVSFADQLKSAVQGVQNAQVARDEQVQSMIRGDQIGVEEIMTTAEEAQLSFDLMLEVRNKLLESYQEIMRMQV